MCCHGRIIFATCGHSNYHPRPLIECRQASFDPSIPWSIGCEIVAHPYKSLRLDQLCPPCQQRRDALMRDIEDKQMVKFDEWQWKVSYGMPSDGTKDYWGKKAEEREEQERKKAEAPSLSSESPSKRKKSGLKRFSWRKSRRQHGNGDRGDVTPTPTPTPTIRE